MNWHRTFDDFLIAINVHVVGNLDAFGSSISVHNYNQLGIPWPEHIALAALATPNGFYMDGSATQIPHGTVPEGTLDRATGLFGALHATFA